MTVPPEAITAAFARVPPHWLKRAGVSDAYARDHVVTGMLEAAAPLIAAAERDRIRQLAERTHAVYCGACSLTDRDRSHEHPVAMVLREPFADLLRDEP